MDEKRCTRCLQWKSLDKFGPSAQGKMGVKAICRPCDAEIHRLRYPREAKVLRARAQRSRDRAAANNLCRECYKPLAGGTKTLCLTCAAKNRAKSAAQRQRHKDACFAAYGGYRCACCGETHKEFLTLDHMGGNGAAHRREMFGANACGSSVVYRYLVKNGFPPGYQVLCFNCNCGRQLNGGICPHKQQ